MTTLIRLILTAAAFAALLTADGIHVTGTPAEQQAKDNATTLASTQSPPLSAIVQQMLQESNNVIAENLARQIDFNPPQSRRDALPRLANLSSPAHFRSLAASHIRRAMHRSHAVWVFIF